jgi:hypothetical protein
MNTLGVIDKTLKDSKKKKGNQSFYRARHLIGQQCLVYSLVLFSWERVVSKWRSSCSEFGMSVASDIDMLQHAWEERQNARIVKVE